MAWRLNFQVHIYNHMSARRIEKINSLLAQEAANLFLTEIELPEGVVATVIRVDTSPDLKYADISISILPANKSGSTLTAIRKKIYKIQKALDHRLAMRPVPKISISLINFENKEMDKLFDEIKKESCDDRG